MIVDAEFTVDSNSKRRERHIRINADIVQFATRKHTIIFVLRAEVNYVGNMEAMKSAIHGM